MVADGETRHVGTVANCSEPDHAGCRHQHVYIPGASTMNFVALVRTARYVISSETTATPGRSPETVTALPLALVHQINCSQAEHQPMEGFE